jgi:hypothetical protein
MTEETKSNQLDKMSRALCFLAAIEERNLNTEKKLANTQLEQLVDKINLKEKQCFCDGRGICSCKIVFNHQTYYIEDAKEKVKNLK